MAWLISRFPELEHLEPEQRAQLLKGLPWWTYPQLIGRAVLGALLIAGVLGGALWSSVDRQAAFILGSIVAVVFGVWFYHQQLSVLRSFVRLEIAKAYSGERPPFCFKCGYDLRGSNEAACPECGKAVERGENEVHEAAEGNGMKPPP
jgi:hypothetical protein